MAYLLARAFVLLVTLLAAWGTALAQGTVLEVIPLRYRTVDQVLPVVQPMLAKGGTVSGLQGQLVVRTTPGNMEEIRRILASIDTMPRRLLISVRQDAYAAYGEHGTSVSGRGGTGGQDGLRARVVDTSSADSDRNTQTVQVTEGSTAFIRVGQSVPVQPQPQPVVRTFPGGGRVVEQAVGGVEYRDV